MAGSSVPESSGDEPAAGASAPPAPYVPAWRRLVRRLLPRTTNEPRTVSGYLEDAPYGSWYLIAAFAIGLAFAALWLWVARVEPVPPGGDPSTWMLTAYAFVGLPTTSGVQPLGYPPLSFPFVGLAIVAGGGPLLGGRIFMAGAIVVLGVAGYLLGRTLLGRPSLAIAFEGLWLGEPDFQQLYYFGGYPNIFALIFLALAVAFFVRYLRSRRPIHLLAFWIAVTVCILSHSLTGVVLLGIIAVACLGLAATSRLPRSLVTSRAGQVGFAVFALSSLAYYAGTALAGIGHPTYLEGVSTNEAKNYLLPTALRAFYLTAPTGWFGGTTATISADVALGITLVIGFGIVATWLILFVRRRGWLSARWTILAAWILTVLAGATVAFVASIPVDFRRLPYFLYPPALLIVLYPIDIVLTARLNGERLGRTTPASAARRGPPPSARWRRGAEPALTVAGLLVVVGITVIFTVPAGESFETFYTEYAHDSDFLAVVDDIAASAVPGNVITTTPYVAHWPSTITTTRLTYVPSLANGNGYAASHVADGETTSVTLTGALTVTNSVVGATIPGLQAGDFNASPIYGVFSGNVYQPLLQLPLAYLSAVLTAGNVTRALVTPGAPAPPVVPLAGGVGYGLNFSTPGITTWENVTAVPGTATVTIQLAVATGPGLPINGVLGRIVPSAGLFGTAAPTASAGGFSWYEATRTGNYSTTGTVTPAAAFSHINPGTPSAGVVPAMLFRENASDQSHGTHFLSLEIDLATPDAANLIPSIGPWLSTTAIWQGWGIRFFLYYNGTASSRPFSADYLAAEYGATLFSRSGPWEVYLLPPTGSGP